LCFTLLATLPAFVSYRVFTWQDRLRRWPASRQHTHGSWRSMLWLVCRQVRWFHVVMLAAGFVIASILPRTEPIAWPFIGVVLGAMLGVSAFAPDQMGGSVRFLGDRRLPLGRWWLVKVALPMITLAVIVLMVMMIIDLTFTLRADVAPRENIAVSWHDIDPYRAVTPAMIPLGPVYGFAVGQFFGLACRKGVVAIVLSMLSAAGLVVVWLPSMVVGGPAAWKWLISPIVLIVATRLAMRPWAAGRLSDWRPAMLIFGAVLLALGGVMLSN
jgi:hypothetical protein